MGLYTGASEALACTPAAAAAPETSVRAVSARRRQLRLDPAPLLALLCRQPVSPLYAVCKQIKTPLCRVTVQTLLNHIIYMYIFKYR